MSNNLLSVLSMSALMAAPLASAFSLTKVANRVFDPAFNRAEFHFLNPDSGEVTIRIYNISGALVRRNLDSLTTTLMYWNGKDQNGARVKGGVYFYQLEASDQVLTGTVVVAK